MTFGERLKELRLAAGMTQDELAEKTGIKKQSISRYENSEREPNIRTAKRIADALGVTLESMSTEKPGVDPETMAEKITAASPRHQELIQQILDAPEDQVEAFLLLMRRPPSDR